jgi:hypothetical protein
VWITGVGQQSSAGQTERERTRRGERLANIAAGKAREAGNERAYDAGVVGGEREPELVIRKRDENIVKRRGSEAEKVAQRNQETRDGAKLLEAEAYSARQRQNSLLQECSKCFTHRTGRDSSG